MLRAYTLIPRVKDNLMVLNFNFKTCAKLYHEIGIQIIFC